MGDSCSLDDVFTTEASDSEQSSARGAAAQKAKERKKAEKKRANVDDTFYEVDKVLDKEWSVRQACFFFFVKWKGWGERRNSWVPAKDVVRRFAHGW